MNPELLFLVPWGVGPAPSALEVETGVVATIEGSGLVGDRVTGGGGGRLAWTPHARARLELSGIHGTSWAMCPDCGASGVGRLSARATLIRHRAFSLAPWAVGVMTPAGPEGLLGFAVEGGSRRLRLDASWPVQSTYELLTTLRIVPEHGVSWAWSDRHATRLVVAGLEPAAAVQHRVAGERWQLTSTLRYGEEGFGAQVGLSLGL